MDTVVKNLQLSLRDFELFDRLFEGGDVSFDEALTAFLLGEDIEAQTERAMTTMTDRVIATSGDVFDEMGEKLRLRREMDPDFDSTEWLNLPSDDELGQRIGGLNAFMNTDLQDALEVPARLLDQALGNNHDGSRQACWKVWVDHRRDGNVDRNQSDAGNAFDG